MYLNFGDGLDAVTGTLGGPLDALTGIIGNLPFIGGLLGFFCKLFEKN